MADLSWLTERPIAHRGFHGMAPAQPENSLSAFAEAVNRGYAIECDLRISRDDIPMVFHDETLDRMTQERGLVHEHAADALAAMRLRDSSDTIPTLRGLLALVSGAVPLVLELKSTPGLDSALVAAVAQELKSYAGPVAVMSFDHNILRGLKDEAPGLPLGLTAGGGIITAPYHLRAIVGIGVHFISYAIDDLPTPLPVLARFILGLRLICWTVKNQRQRLRANRWTQQMTFEGFSPDEPG